MIPIVDAALPDAEGALVTIWLLPGAAAEL